MFQNLKKSVASSAAWAITCLFVLGCVCFDRGSGKPLPAEYIGFWKGSDSSTLEVAGNGSVNFKQGNVEYKGASLEVDEGGKVLRMKFLGFEVRSFTINQPPGGGRMVLDNITYIRRGVSEKDKTEEDYQGRSFPSNANDDGDYLGEKRTNRNLGMSESEMVYLLTETILDFDKAIQAEDFSDFPRFRCSRTFRQQYTSDDLISIFSQFIQQKEAIGMVLEQVAEVPPSFSHEFVKSGGNDVLKIKGSFNTTPNKTYFDNEYLLEDGEWKLIKIKIQIR
jgi:hypothetical protein